jgi:hypothetical protein
LIACATGNLDEAAMWLTQEVLGDSAPVVAASGRALPLEEAVAEAEAVLEMQRTMAGTQPMT